MLSSKPMNSPTTQLLVVSYRRLSSVPAKTRYCVVASGCVVHTADTVSFVAVFAEIVRI